MSPLQKLSASLHLNFRARNLLRLTMLPVITASFLYAPIGHPVLAAAAQADTSAIDPAAVDAMKKMGTYLRTLNSFQVTADTTTDDVTVAGQTIQSGRKVDLLAARPNRLRIEIIGDDIHRMYFFDGKNFSIFAVLAGYYATVPAPPTIAELADKIDEKYGIELPLTDLFKWGTDDTLVQRIKTATDVGPATIQGVTCEQYAFHQEGIDWQIWVQMGDYPLPRKLVITTLSDDARPQHSEVLTWNLAPSFNDLTFTFDPPADAKRIAVEEVKSDSTGKKN